MATENGYTPTQRAILAVLADGMAHTRAELVAALPDELAEPSAVHDHLYHLRRRLWPRGETILCEWVNHRPRYRHVRLLQSGRGGRDI